MPIKKLQTLPKALLQALKDYYNKYFRGYNYRNACINRRGYLQMLAVVMAYPILVIYMADYLDFPYDSPHSLAFQSFISSPYFTFFLFLLLFYVVIGVVFIIIVGHRCRDIGISRWYTLLIFVPYIKIAFIIILGCLEKDAVKKYRKKYRLGKNKKTGL